MSEEINNIVFLDIDGVLLTNFSNFNINMKFEEEAVLFLNKLYDNIKYDLVLCSSWKNAFTFKYMQNLLKNNGIKAELIDKTYIVTTTEKKIMSINLSDELKVDKIGSRTDEIREWIDMFNPKQYLILDDFYMDIEELEKHRITRLNPFEKGGFVNMKDFDNAVKILKMQKKNEKINENEYVYCTHCDNFRISKEEIPTCKYENKCNILDCEDSKPHKERPYYKNIQD